MVGSDGEWSITASMLTNGAHDITATVEDASGNVSAHIRCFAYNH